MRDECEPLRRRPGASCRDQYASVIRRMCLARQSDNVLLSERQRIIRLQGAYRRGVLHEALPTREANLIFSCCFSFESFVRTKRNVVRDSATYATSTKDVESRTLFLRVFCQSFRSPLDHSARINSDCSPTHGSHIKELTVYGSVDWLSR